MTESDPRGMKIYTRTGDEGETALLGGGRVPKDHPRVAAYGSLDELNAFFGRAITIVHGAETRARLERLQHDLFALGAHLAAPAPSEGRRRPALPPLPEGRIAEMEAWIDGAELRLPPLRAFILPGGSPGGAELHLCRTAARRAERAVLPLAREGDPDAAAAIRYLNRLSDLLFVLARLENLEAGGVETEWRKEEG